MDQQRSRAAATPTTTKHAPPTPGQAATPGQVVTGCLYEADREPSQACAASHGGRSAPPGIIDVLGNFAFALALSRAPLLPVALLSGMYPVATAALAWLVVGERLAVRQRWGAGAALVGAALMAAR